MKRNAWIATVAGAALVIGVVPVLSGGCQPSQTNTSVADSGTSVTGAVDIDGSSTVTPIMEAVSEEFKVKYPKSEPSVATSGTGGGFKKFAAGEIDISMASRPIKPEEADKCKAANIEFIEIPVALDGLTIVVHMENTWCDHLTVGELKKIWEPGSTVKNWKDVRAGFPDVPIKLYGPGTDSGTFDYFTQAINGKEKASRADYQASEDDNVLVQGVVGDKGSLGYFGYGYFEANKDKLRLVKVDAEKGAGPVAPTETTIVSATYQPLSRPLFIYINKQSATDKPAVAAIVEFLLSDGSALIKESGYLPLPADVMETVAKHWKDRKTGSMFHGTEVGLGIKEVMTREQGH